MNKYDKLLEKVVLPNGAVLNSRTVMAPMGILGAHENGNASEADVKYFDKRSDVAGMIITGHVAISEHGWERNNQLGLFNDSHIEPMQKMTTAAKKDGNKVIAQLQHAGLAANKGKDVTGKIMVPSVFEGLTNDSAVHELTEEEINSTIKDYGTAAKRAIDAGFDGVEIHGANNYLVQEFFSKYSNRRQDKWGGNLENRMKFPLAVVKEIQEVIKNSNKKDFILGIRVSPEEIHEDFVGYDIEDTLQLVDKLCDSGVDYIHISLFSKYDMGPKNSKKSYAKLFKEKANDRVPIIAASGVSNADDALDALNHGDLISIGRETLIEPEFTKKIKENKVDEIKTRLNNNLEELAIPDATIALFVMDGSPLEPLPGMETLSEEVLNQDREKYVFDESTKN